MVSFANKIRRVTNPNLCSLPISARWSRSPLPPLVGRCVLGRGAGSKLQPGVGAVTSGRTLGGVAGSSLTVAQVIAVEDETRRRIERDLHDGLQQQLVSLALRVRAAETMVPAELLELRAELSGVVDEHTNLLDQLREIVHGIHPAILSESGLTPALKTLARRSPIPVELKVRVEARLPEEVELAAYYIVAEALTNTAKYSHASLVDVLVQTRGRTLRVAVRDDGVGGADPARGTGLLGVKERAEAIGGTVSLHSPPAAGTLLDAALPLGEKS
jgi:signal transduction histidine kinase